MADYQTDALTPDHVDLDKPLSDDMKTWLINRNRADLVEENARRLGAEADKARAAVQQASSVAQQENMAAAQAAAGGPVVGAVTLEPEGGDEPDDYDEWTVAELQAEAGERKLSKSGTKAELIERLRANDAEE